MHGGSRPVPLRGSTSRRGASFYSSLFHLLTEKELRHLPPRPGTQPSQVHPFPGDNPSLTLLQGYHVPDPAKTPPGGTSRLSPASIRGNSLTRSQTSPGESRGRQRQQLLPSPARAASGTCPEPQEPPPLPHPHRERRDGTVPASPRSRSSLPGPRQLLPPPARGGSGRGLPRPPPRLSTLATPHLLA